MPKAANILALYKKAYFYTGRMLRSLSFDMRTLLRCYGRPAISVHDCYNCHPDEAKHNRNKSPWNILRIHMPFPFVRYVVAI